MSALSCPPMTHPDKDSIECLYCRFVNSVIKSAQSTRPAKERHILYIYILIIAQMQGMLEECVKSELDFLSLFQ